MIPFTTRFIPVIVIAILVSGAFVPAIAQDGQPAADSPVVASKEYFVQQQDGEAVVVRINASEAQFVSRLLTENGEPLVESGLPEARNLPLYQFVAVTDLPRQINIEVEATQATNRTEFSLGLTRLNVRDDRSAGIASAYRLLSGGLEVLPEGSVPEWTVRIQTLLRAASLFENIGMQEMKLWSQVFATHAILYELRDPQTALEGADQLLAEPRIQRFPEIDFAARKLRSASMIEGRIGVRATGSGPSRLQQALADTLEAAQSLDFQLEQALALSAMGVDLLEQGKHRQAMGRLEAALEIADKIEATDLAAEIREHMVEIYSQDGDRDATGDVLQDIESHLVEEGDEQELAVNLIRQGQLFIDRYRYDEAIEVLSRAAGLEQSNLSRFEADLSLGMALSAAGRQDEALVHLYRAVQQPQGRGFRRPSDVLDIDSGMNRIAAIHRLHGDWEKLEEIRAAQRGYLNTAEQRAGWWWQTALDAERRHGLSSGVTRERYAEASRRAAGVDTGNLRALSLLGLCSLPAVDASADSRCRAEDLQREYRAISAGGAPDQATRAALSWSRLLARNGQAAAALGVLEERLDQLGEDGHESLGAWYWYWRETLVDQFMSLAIETEPGTEDASASLQALLKARRFERDASRQGPSDRFTDLQAALGTLPGDSALLSFYLGGGSAHIWLARREAVRRIVIRDSQRIAEISRQMRRSMQSGDWQQVDQAATLLGSILIAPVAGQLPETVFVVSHGALLGIPFDALRIDGQPLAALHRVVHVDGPYMRAADSVPDRLAPPSMVFLAGDPRDWSGEYASQLETSAEVDAVRDQFVGPGLHTVQGVALLADEFQDERYREADLVHLSIPGVIDLSPARISGLFLSEPARGEGRQRLDATALMNINTGARLVFLSRTEFAGLGASLENDLGVVTSILNAGAAAVIASLWPLEPAERERFVAGFYTHLDGQQDIASALALTKRAVMRNGESRDWAGFQLFLN